MNTSSFLGWCETLINGLSQAGEWLVTEIKVTDNFAFSPLTLITFAGLTAFILIAVVKWVVS